MLISIVLIVLCILEFILIYNELHLWSPIVYFYKLYKGTDIEFKLDSKGTVGGYILPILALQELEGQNDVYLENKTMWQERLKVKL